MSEIKNHKWSDTDETLEVETPPTHQDYPDYILLNFGDGPIKNDGYIHIDISDVSVMARHFGLI